MNKGGDSMECAECNGELELKELGKSCPGHKCSCKFDIMVCTQCQRVHFEDGSPAFDAFGGKVYFRDGKLVVGKKA